MTTTSAVRTVTGHTDGPTVEFGELPGDIQSHTTANGSTTSIPGPLIENILNEILADPVPGITKLHIFAVNSQLIAL